MNSIKWCKTQAKGISFIEPNRNLSEEYYQNAEESMKVLRAVYPTGSLMWLATIKYYIEYFAAYSLLMRIGIKCEIHECTIALLNFLEKNEFIEPGLTKQIADDKELRIDNQYHLKNKQVEINFDKMASFLLSIRKRIDSLTPEEIKTIRNKITYT